MTRGHGKSDLKRQHDMPTVWLMTDPRIATPDLLRAIARLPRGAAIIVRHYHLSGDDRRALFDQMRRVAQRRGAKILLAGDAEMARAWGADGHHGRMPARVESPGSTALLCMIIAN